MCITVPEKRTAFSAKTPVWLPAYRGRFKGKREIQAQGKVTSMLEYFCFIGPGHQVCILLVRTVLRFRSIAEKDIKSAIGVLRIRTQISPLSAPTPGIIE
ncbi:hypothetical protein GCM10027085_22650 [Spirosoma aerophilum]